MRKYPTPEEIELAKQCAEIDRSRSVLTDDNRHSRRALEVAERKARREARRKLLQVPKKKKS